MSQQESRSAGQWAYNPEREAAWRAEMYPALLRSMAKNPDWAKEVLAAWPKKHGHDAAEQLRQDARAAYREMHQAGEL
jgi:hypothetical protein